MKVNAAEHYAELMGHAVILGGTGVLGRAAAGKLLHEGWAVDVVGRSAANLPDELRTAGAIFRAADRYEPSQLRTVLGAGADLLVDALSFTGSHAALLLPYSAEFSSTVMLSSKAVYRDDAGRHVNSAEPPRFSRPITEEQQTLPAQDSAYDSPEGYGPNKVSAENVLLDSRHPVTVIRASKVHGVGATPPPRVDFRQSGSRWPKDGSPGPLRTRRRSPHGRRQYRRSHRTGCQDSRTQDSQ